MDCKEFEKCIPDFIKRKLDYVTLKALSEHMDKCPQCREELTIQFLIDEGLVRLEEGSAFDLKHELWVRMNEARKKIHRHDMLIVAGTLFEYMVMILTAVVVVGIIIW